MKRVVTAAVCGFITALAYTAVSILSFGAELGASSIASGCVWRIFIFTIFSSFGAILTELKMK
jgi:hypothetical protein